MRVREVADRVNRHYRTVLKWVLVGWSLKGGPPHIRLRATRPGKIWAVSEEDLEIFLEACRNASISDPPPDKAPRRKQRGPPDKAKRIEQMRRGLEAMGI